VEVLVCSIDQELKREENLAFRLRMRMAGFPMETRLEDFDMRSQPFLDPTVIHDPASLRFIHNAKNVVFLGPSGIGKTHLALDLSCVVAQVRVQDILRECVTPNGTHD